LILLEDRVLLGETVGMMLSWSWMGQPAIVDPAPETTAVVSHAAPADGQTTDTTGLVLAPGADQGTAGTSVTSAQSATTQTTSRTSSDGAFLSAAGACGNSLGQAPLAATGVGNQPLSGTALADSLAPAGASARPAPTGGSSASPAHTAVQPGAT